MAGITDRMLEAAEAFGRECSRLGAGRPTGISYDPKGGGVSIDYVDSDGLWWTVSSRDGGVSADEAD